ncbi:MAG: hypothetical protein HQK53_19315, partial [Oligoflexia bacterium]|nr:hypothetical protein [Oligoflexia bacterium]
MRTFLRTFCLRTFCFMMPILVSLFCYQSAFAYHDINANELTNLCTNSLLIEKVVALEDKDGESNTPLVLAPGQQRPTYAYVKCSNVSSGQASTAGSAAGAIEGDHKVIFIQGVSGQPLNIKGEFDYSINITADSVTIGEALFKKGVKLKSNSLIIERATTFWDDSVIITETALKVNNAVVIDAKKQLLLSVVNGKFENAGTVTADTLGVKSKKIIGHLNSILSASKKITISGFDDFLNHSSTMASGGDIIISGGSGEGLFSGLIRNIGKPKIFANGVYSLQCDYINDTAETYARIGAILNSNNEINFSSSASLTTDMLVVKSPRFVMDRNCQLMAYDLANIVVSDNRNMGIYDLADIKGRILVNQNSPAHFDSILRAKPWIPSSYISQSVASPLTARFSRYPMGFRLSAKTNISARSSLFQSDSGIYIQGKKSVTLDGLIINSPREIRTSVLSIDADSAVVKGELNSSNGILIATKHELDVLADLHSEADIKLSGSDIVIGGALNADSLISAAASASLTALADS